MKRLNYDYEGFIGQITSGLEDTTMTAQEVVRYMEDYDEMPEGVSLWEPLEHSSPRQLVKNGLGLKVVAPEVKALIRSVKALGKAIEKGDPQNIADRYGNVLSALGGIE